MTVQGMLLFVIALAIVAAVLSLLHSTDHMSRHH